MIPNSVSATSLTTARLCPARYMAENIIYGRGMDNPAALLGTTIHSALELYVNEVYVQRSKASSADLLRDYFELYFIKNFGSGGDDTFRESGLEMCERWAAEEAQHMAGREVISLEQKKFIMLDTSAGPIKLNYILDRFDRVGPNRYEIIDYKSSIKNIRENELRTLLQPKIYVLAMFIEHPEAESMSVIFDMLRYQKTGPVEFSKDEARAVFDEVLDIIETKILAVSADDPPEVLNNSCNYCVRKASCATLQRNVDAGGLFSLDLTGQIDLRTELELKMKGMKALQKELDGVIEASLGESHMAELSTGHSRAFFTTKRKNVIKSVSRAVEIVGRELFDRYGKTDITLAEYKKMIKDPSLSPEQRDALTDLLVVEYADPKLNFENERGEVQTGLIAPDLTGKLVAAAPRGPILGLED